MEHHGMQDFGVLQGQGEASFPPMDKKSSILSCWAVPPAHGIIRSIPWAWLGVGEPRQSWALWGVSSSSAPTCCTGAGSTWCGGE